MEVNSKNYWDNRFSTDWIERFGREQSAFFAQMAISSFPSWFVDEVTERRSNICDWGCALGDGTNEIHNKFPHSEICGIDFSGVAIEKAKDSFPSVTFLAENLLDTKKDFRFDIVFSSNTLEHFAKPWEILYQLSKVAQEHIVILIPYKEINLYSEHLYAFNENNIVSSVDDRFLLTHFEISDGSERTPSYWGELQVLLIFSNKSVIEERKLKTLSDTDIRVIDGFYSQKDKVSKLGQKIDKLSQSNVTDSAIAERDQVIAQLQQQLQTAVREKEVAEIGLKETIEDRISREEGFNRSLQELQVEFDVVSNVLESAKKEFEIERENSSKALEGIKSEFENALTVLKQRDAELREENRQRVFLEEQIAQYKLIIVSQKQEIKQTQEQMEMQLSTSAAALKECEMRLGKELSVKQNEISSLETQLNNLSSDRNRLNDTNKFLTSRVSDLSATIERLSNELNNSKTVLQKANAKVGVSKLLEEELKEKDILVEKLKQEVANESAAKRNLEESVERFTKRIQELEVSVSWYHATYESRSFLGVVKDKALKKMK